MVLALVRKGWDLWEEKVKRGHDVPLDLRGIASPKGKKRSNKTKDRSGYHRSLQRKINEDMN